MQRRSRASAPPRFPGLSNRNAAACTWRSLPLDGGWRFAADVVGDAVDAAHFVDDAAGNLLEQGVGQLGPVSGHEVAGLHRTQRDDIVVRAAVAHHANALD